MTATSDRTPGGTAGGPAFERSEYERRLVQVRREMAARAIDVLVLSDPANINYLTGYDAWSFYVHQVLLVGADPGDPTWIGRASDAHGVGFTTHLAPARAIGYPEECVESIDRHAMLFVADYLKEAGFSNARIGVEMEAYYYTARCHALLTKGLTEGPTEEVRRPGQAELVDATGLVNRIRLVKSGLELVLLREAARIAELTMETAVRHIEPGRRQNDLAAAISHAQITGTEAFGGDYPAIVPLLPTGERSGAPHLTWSDQPFVRGEGTIIEIAGCRRRYHCPLARTVFLGKPPPKVTDTAKAVVEGVEAALDAARPGARAEDVEAAWRDCVARWGVVKESRLGYSIGINYPPDWGEHSASLRRGDTTVLQTGMTFHLMPGLWYERWGIEISQPFAVTEHGSEALTRFPRELIVKD